MKLFSFLGIVGLLVGSFTVYGQPMPTASTGTIRRFQNFASEYVAPRHVDVWLPEGYSANEKYAVLYMHDGQMLFDSTTTWNKAEWGVDETAGALIKQHKIRNMIVVGIWNGGALRHSEYFPQKAFEWLKPEQQEMLYAANRQSGASVFQGHKVQSDNYLRFIVKELKPFIDREFSTLPDAANTFIAGSSMGGLISMYAFCEYPEVFGGAACLSTHWPGIFTMDNNPVPDAFFNYLNAHLPKPSARKIYFDFGTATLDSLYPPLQAKVDEIMKQKGYTNANWMTRAFPGKDHSERAWNERFYLPLEFLMGVSTHSKH